MNANLNSDLDVIAEVTRLEERIKEADIVITGEGSFDLQSLNGKAPTRVARLARKHKKELFDQIYTIVPTVATKEESLQKPKFYLKKLLERIKLILFALFLEQGTIHRDVFKVEN